MRRLLPLLVPALLVLAACGSSGGDEPAVAGTGTPVPSTPEEPGGNPAAGGISQADNDLQIEIDLGDGSAPATWTLTCVGFVEGSHPAAQAACDHLAGLERPFEPLPEDVVCSQQYGGPETAHVLGRWAGEPVDLQLSRVDGCRLAQWDALVPLLPPPAA